MARFGSRIRRTAAAGILSIAMGVGMIAGPGLAASAAPGDAVMLQVGQTVSFQVTNPGLTDRYLRHLNSLVRTDVLSSTSGESARRDASFVIRAGLDGAGCYSFESVNFPGEYLRHSGFRLRTARAENSSLYRQDATFCAQQALGGSGVSLVSRNLPGHYIRHRGAEVWVERPGTDAGGRLDASWTLTAPLSGSGGATLPTSDTPDFGPAVRIYDPSTPIATIQGQIDQAFTAQLLSPTAQFGEQRNVFLFKPGTYGRVFANVGFYTTVAGLGLNPDDVTLRGGVNVDAGWNFGDERNATQNFWRSMENLAIEPEGGINRWAVSQAAPMRRIHIRGNLTLAPSNQDFGQGYSSGGYLADSRVDGFVTSGSQQQWYTRDSTIGRWEGGVWNMTYSGVQGAPAQSFPAPPYTTLPTTPVTREKPYLYVDGGGRYRVFVPSLRRESSGATWPNTAGTSLPMREFYVAKPGDSAARINQALSQGLNLFFTPGTYPLTETIRVTRPDTVVTGIGFPTLVPQNGIEAMNIANAQGVKVSSLTFDAGAVNSPTIMSVGSPGVHTDLGGNPISLQDVFFRIGSSIQGNATNTLVVHADDTIIDHIWAWRADHGGAPTGWNVNKGDTGVIVNGDDVLATGLFVEHYQKDEVIWNGERGRTIFFQNEKPYDVPDQASWRSPTGQGYAAYKVADSVTEHRLWGGGVYCFFNADPSVRVDRGFEVPRRPGVQLRGILTVSLGDVGTIGNVVNDVGGAVPNPAGNTVPRTVSAFGG
ncbi:MAG: hypothetical protein RI885_1641 [Actinomycetota bacterium]